MDLNIIQSRPPSCRIGLLICDLDNTLYDWVAYFVPSLYAMIEKASDILQIETGELIAELRSVHQRHQNTEHPYALLEISSYKEWSNSFKGNAREAIDPAFHAFNSSRKRYLRLYPGVLSTFEYLRSSGIQIVGYSDSGYFGVLDRLRRLGILEFFERVYCLPRADETVVDLRRNNSWIDERIVELHNTPRKPNPSVLSRICLELGVSVKDTAYVGDSKSKDVWMANQVGMYSIWAKYGTSVDKEFYDKLVAVTHWTHQDVVRERQISTNSSHAKPNFICENSFDELRAVVLQKNAQTRNVPLNFQFH